MEKIIAWADKDRVLRYSKEWPEKPDTGCECATCLGDIVIWKRNLEKAKQESVPFEDQQWARENIQCGANSIRPKPDTFYPLEIDGQVEIVQSDKAHDKCIATNICQETESFKGTEHEGVDMCEDGCVWGFRKVARILPSQKENSETNGGTGKAWFGKDPGRDALQIHPPVDPEHLARENRQKPEVWVEWLNKRINLKDFESDYILFALKEYSFSLRSALEKAEKERDEFKEKVLAKFYTPVDSGNPDHDNYLERVIEEIKQL
jgi:hypothetical protein